MVSETDLEKIILSEETQTQNDKYRMFSFIWAPSYKSSAVSISRSNDRKQENKKIPFPAVGNNEERWRKNRIDVI